MSCLAVKGADEKEVPAADTSQKRGKTGGNRSRAGRINNYRWAFAGTWPKGEGQRKVLTDCCQSFHRFLMAFPWSCLSWPC